MTEKVESPAVVAEADIEPAEFGTTPVELSVESLADLRTLPGSPLSLAVERVLEEGRSGALVSARFNSTHP